MKISIWAHTIQESEMKERKKWTLITLNLNYKTQIDLAVSTNQIITTEFQTDYKLMYCEFKSLCW